MDNTKRDFLRHNVDNVQIGLSLFLLSVYIEAWSALGLAYIFTPRALEV